MPIEAELRIMHSETLYLIELVLSSAIEQPTPEHPVLGHEWLGSSYKEQVVVVANEWQGGVGTTIHTRTGSGRGQTAVFDRLVGEQVARERKKLAKLMRETFSDEESVTVYLTDEEVREIEDRLRVHSDSLTEDQFLWRAPSWYMKTMLVTDKSFSFHRAMHVPTPVHK